MISDVVIPQRIRRLPLTMIHILLLIAIAGFTIWLSYIGFLASDDQSYAEAAIGWLSHFPYIGTNHWSLRHTVVLPLAFSFWLGGINEASIVASGVVYLLLLILMTYSCLARSVGPRHALLAAALI